MSTTPTVKYGWLLPVPGTEVDTWGTKLNAVFTEIDLDLFNELVAKVNKAGDTMTGNLIIASATAIALTIQGEANVQAFLERYATDLNPPILMGRKARGTIALPTDVITNDQLWELRAQGYAGGAFRNSGRFTFSTMAAVPSATDMQGKFFLLLSPNGSVVPVSIITADWTNGIVLGIPLGLASGGTGGATALAALANLGAVALAGDTMTGPLRVPAGTSPIPGLQVGDADTGLVQTAGNLWSIVDGSAIARFTTTSLVITGIGIVVNAAAGGALNTQFTGENTVQILLTRSAADTIGPIYSVRKSRGTLAIPALINSGDSVGNYGWQGYSGAGYTIAGLLNVTVIAGVPSVTDFEARAILSLVPPASGVASEIMRLAHATGLSMFGANIVIDQDRNLRLRLYTIATLPAHTTGKTVYCSDLGGGGGQLVSNGTDWLRINEGFSTSAITTDFARTYLTHSSALELTGILVADRVVTLGAAPSSSTWEFISIGAHAFKHDIGGIANIRTNEWVQVVTDGTTWRVKERGYVVPPISLDFFISGVPPISTRLWQFIATEPFQLPDQYAGSRGWCQTAPGASIAFDVRKNNISIGTMTFASTNVATFVNTAAGADQFNIGDRLAVHSPAALSALGDLSVNFAGLKQ